MTSPLLKVENLITHFDITSGILGNTTHVIPAVDDVSFNINSSQTLSLVGESGCGKSTVARSILKLIQPKSGKIVFKGVDELICSFNTNTKEVLAYEAKQCSELERTLKSFGNFSSIRFRNGILVT